MTLSYSWILTSIGVLIDGLLAILFFTLYIGTFDIGTIFQFIVMSAFTIYICYMTEFVMKKEFLRQHDIQHINNDLKNLLINFPKPIILFDNFTQKVVLANQEVRNILNVEGEVDDKNYE